MNEFIAIRNLWKSYGNVPAVRGISFSVGAGETFGLIGPNGAGKSTTINCLYGLVTPDTGDATVAGLDIRRDLRRIKALAGIVPQDDCLDPDLSVEENLWTHGMYFGIDRATLRRRTDEILDFVGLGDHRKKNIPELSGGMRRRLLLSRALVNDPRLLILDEPTTGLDPQARHMVWSRLRELKRRGVSMLLTTHYMEEAQTLCDRVAIIDHGQTQVESTPADLIRRYAGTATIELHAVDLPETVRARFTEGNDLQRFEDMVYLFPREHTPDILAVLAESGTAFTHRPANLEDVFLKIVGRGLRDV